jgi:DNA/RNA-binding domain of Phe-tRNA-synthetase-like protein
VQSQIDNYRAKAKEFARLTVTAKSLRHSRQYRKLAEMYWALALGEDPKRAKPSEMQVKRTT